MKVYFDSLSLYQYRPRYQADLSTTSGWMSKGANGISDSEGTSLWLLSRELIKATSIVYFPAFRSASTRFTVSVALPVDTSTLTPNFFWKTSTTGRYCLEGAPPEAIATVPSCFAAATSLAHSWSKFAVAEAPWTVGRKSKDPDKIAIIIPIDLFATLRDLQRSRSLRILVMVLFLLLAQMIHASRKKQ